MNIWPSQDHAVLFSGVFSMFTSHLSTRKRCPLKPKHFDALQKPSWIISSAAGLPDSSMTPWYEDEGAFPSAFDKSRVTYW